MTTTALNLPLHGTVSRADAYGLFGIQYDTRATRHLNVGLSPQLPDGGYFIFVTLDKTTLAQDYDYEDELFRERLVWVTKRGAKENDSDYVALRLPNTRISLFVRRADRQSFRYLGEVTSEKHRPFIDDKTGLAQQRYVLRLKCPSRTTYCWS